MSETKPVKVKHTEESFRDKIADLFEEMWEKIGKYHHGVSGRAAQHVPADTDLSEAEDVLTYSIELPGMDENNVEVAVESGRLVVRGEKRDEREERGENYVFRERRFGRFERSFALPSDAVEDNITARFDKGVLTIGVPCTPTSARAAKQIKITST